MYFSFNQRAQNFKVPIHSRKQYLGIPTVNWCPKFSCHPNRHDPYLSLIILYFHFRLHSLLAHFCPKCPNFKTFDPKRSSMLRHWQTWRQKIRWKEVGCCIPLSVWGRHAHESLNLNLIPTWLLNSANETSLDIAKSDMYPSLSSSHWEWVLGQ